MDKFLQTETVVSLTDVTNIYFSVTNDAASKTADRFMIVFGSASDLRNARSPANGTVLLAI